jgi:hypothetical protein
MAAAVVATAVTARDASITHGNVDVRKQCSKPILPVLHGGCWIANATRSKAKAIATIGIRHIAAHSSVISYIGQESSNYVKGDNLKELPCGLLFDK